MKELSPQPNKERIQVINAAYDQEMSSLVNTLTASDYMSDVREWCVESANYLVNPIMRQMYQEAGL